MRAARVRVRKRFGRAPRLRGLEQQRVKGVERGYRRLREADDVHLLLAILADGQRFAQLLSLCEQIKYLASIDLEGGHVQR